MKSHYQIRKALLALAALGLAYGVPVHATDSGYLKCLKTPPVHFNGTIVDAVVQTCKDTGQLCTLRDLVLAAGLAGALSGPGPLTVYAPTDEAFDKIDKEVLTAIGSDIPLLTTVLTYHVSLGIKDPRRPLLPKEEKTLLKGQTVFLDYDKKPQVNQSNASCKGVRTTNGIVWIIDSVLLPQFK